MLKLRNRALGLLARREHSRLELWRKLQVGVDLEVLEDLLQTLTTEGLQSDARFTESYVRSRAQSGYGPLRIRQELQERGVDNDLINKYLIEDAIEWRHRLQETWKKKYHRLLPKDQKELARQVRFLLSRGFPQPWVMKLFASSLNKLE